MQIYIYMCVYICTYYCQVFFVDKICHYITEFIVCCVGGAKVSSHPWHTLCSNPLSVTSMHLIWRCQQVDESQMSVDVVNLNTLDHPYDKWCLGVLSLFAVPGMHLSCCYKHKARLCIYTFHTGKLAPPCPILYDLLQNIFVWLGSDAFLKLQVFTSPLFIFHDNILLVCSKKPSSVSDIGIAKFDIIPLFVWKYSA